MGGPREEEGKGPGGPLCRLSPQGYSASFTLGKPLPNVCLKRLRGLENRRATSTLGNPVRQQEPQFSVRMVGGAWPYSQNPNAAQQEAP